MKFDKYLSVNMHFQSSINISLDLGNLSMINNYILTSTGLEYLNHFIDNIIYSSGDHSSLLVAPYGKGKSHAILILLSLLKLENYSDLQIFLKKIENKDKSLLKKIRMLENKKFLPIIISSTRGTLNQSLMRALDKALQKDGLGDLIVDTDFKLANNRITDWSNHYSETYEAFKTALEKRKIIIDDFRSDLKTYNENALEIFKQIHKEILSGSEFSPNIALEIIDYYQDVLNKLITSYHYDGAYIIFDEFSKFIESRDITTVPNDMKILQDLAELCNSSENIFLQLVLHKPINQYLNIDKSVKNAFKGIEGRVETYYFTSSLQNSFELIANVLVKNDSYKIIEDQNKELNKKLINDIREIPGFYIEFSEQYLDLNLIYDIYPLHPIAAYLLVKINEKVAQNERTLFTFLAKHTDASLTSIIKKDYDYPYITPSSVFNYFESQFLENKDDANIYRIASKAVSALTLVNMQVHKEFLKTLALLLIINEKDLMPTNLSILSYALMLSYSEVEKITKDLTEKGILVMRHGGKIEFRINMDINIDNIINNIINTKFIKVNIEKELNQLIRNKYIYPRTYNISENITRYFQIEYMAESDFLSLTNIDYFFENDFKDGMIINIVRSNNNSKDLILEKINKFDNIRLVVVYPNSYTDYEEDVKRLLAIKYVLEDKSFIDDNLLIVTELEMLYDDVKDDLNEKLDKDYSLSSQFTSFFNTYNFAELSNVQRMISKNRVFSEILNHIFYASPKINLELINRNYVKGNYKAAREKVCDKLINRTIIIDNLGTSPEDTIINCVLLETKVFFNNQDTNITQMIQIIIDFFENDDGEISTLFRQLMLPPYGIRKGIIPIFISYVIGYKLRHSILFYFKGKELDLNGRTIELLTDNPDEYSFKSNDITEDKLHYLNDLQRIFTYDFKEDKLRDYNLIASDIRNWYISLPKITKQMIGKDECINQKGYKLLKKYCSTADINPSDFLFDNMLRVAETDTFDCIDKLLHIKNTLDTYLNNYLTKIKGLINSVLGFSESANLWQSLHYWIDNNKETLDNSVLDNSTKEVLENIDKDYDKNEFKIVNMIAHAYTLLFVEDWSENTLDLFLDNISVLKKYESLNQHNRNDNQVIVYLGNEVFSKSFDDKLDDSTELIENIIEDAIDDYGDILTNEQKLALLIKILKKYI